MAQATNNYGSAALPYQYRADQRQCDGGGVQQHYAHVTVYTVSGILYATRVTVYTTSHSTYASTRRFPAASREGRI